MSKKIVIHVVLEEGIFEVGYIKSPYEAKDDIKWAPMHSRWDARRKMWVTQDPYEMAQWLKNEGWDVEVRDSRKQQKQQQQKQQPKPKAKNADAEWVAELKKALPEHLHEPAYKALLRVVHPDVGGDSRAAQQLNDGFRERRRSA